MVGAVTAGPVPVDIAVVAGKDPVEQLVEIDLRAGPELEDGHPGSGVRDEHVQQAVAATLDERRGAGREIGHAPSRGRDREAQGLHGARIRGATRSTIRHRGEAPGSVQDRMSRRIDVELTSVRDDGTWTWRAAGARQPKGELDGSLVPQGTTVGDVVRAEAEFYVDGITIVSILPPKQSRREPDRLELIGPTRQEPLVTTRLSGKDDGDRDTRRDRGRGERRGPGERVERRPRGPRSDRDGRGRNDRGAHAGGSDRRSDRDRKRAERPAPDPKPRAKRLKAGRTHRNAALASLPDLQRPIAEVVLRGGVPAVRQAIDKQNALARAEGKPLVDTDRLLALAERMLPALRAAEWRDRAVAALAQVDEVDLRDLRSVVVAADAAARDDETRALADQLRDALAERVNREHHAWLADIVQLLGEGRVVRALRVSSRPPKAGAPLPADVSERLIAATSASLTADISVDRWVTVLDALAFSPVRHQVEPVSIPEHPSDELLAAVRKQASRLPEIAARFGIELAAKAAPVAGTRPVPPPSPPPLPASGASVSQIRD